VSPAPPVSEDVDTSTGVDATSVIEEAPEGVDVELVNTSTGVDSTNLLDTPAGVDVEGITSNFTETLISNVPAALQYGDMAALGLASWYPAGIIRWSMELINVSTGMPWFWTIIAGTALWKFFCVPFAIKGLQESARMVPLQPQIKKFQASITRCRASQNPLELQRVTQEMRQFYEFHNIHPLLGAVAGLIQIPVVFGMFFGVQKMCSLPLEQLTYSGLSYIPDLTVADPTMCLPLAMFVLVNVQIKVGLPDYDFFLLILHMFLLQISVRDMNTTEQPFMGHIMNIFRVLTIPGIYFMANFPSVSCNNGVIFHISMFLL
jgi:YidC/Oxa1 family membrane protein insertase